LPLERQPVGALKFTRRQAKGIQQFFGYAADLYNVARELRARQETTASRDWFEGAIV
jgi:hypothetical protein